MRRILSVLAGIALVAAASLGQVQAQTYHSSSQWLTANATAVSVPTTGSTQLVAFSTGGINRIFVQCTPTTNPLAAFVIKATQFDGAAFVTLYSASTDYTAPKGAMIAASGNLAAQAAGTTGWFIMDTRGMAGVALYATAGTATATVSCNVSGF